VQPQDVPLLARSVFDRAAHRRLDPEWLEDAWLKARVLLVSEKSTTPVDRQVDKVRLQLAFASELASVDERWFLGVADEVPYFAVLSQADSGWLGIRDIGLLGDDLELDLLVTSVALTQWHLRHEHCARCGALTKIEHAGWIRRCPVDGSEHFPRTDPAVIMLVHDGADRCLLGRGTAWGPGRFSTLAGFVEPGESLEAAVQREVFEEVAVAVTDVRYVASQPWPFPSSLMLGFSARAEVAGELTPDLVEMAEAGWFTRAEVQRAADRVDSEADITATIGEMDGVVLQAISPRLSISRYLIDLWLAGQLPS
jgi:NAD+ diphosphatase